jgi:hypothetical protein
MASNQAALKGSGERWKICHVWKFGDGKLTSLPQYLDTGRCRTPWERSTPSGRPKPAWLRATAPSGEIPARHPVQVSIGGSKCPS